MTDNQQVLLDATGGSSDINARLGAASRAALHRGRFLRLAISGAIAVLSSVWIGWWALACWIAILTTDRLILPVLERIFVAPVSADRNQSQRRRAVLRAIGSAVHCIPWAAAWAVGGDQAGFLAGMLLCGGFILALVYYAECRWLFMATIVPQIVISGALQALFQPQNVLPSMIVPALLIGTLRLVYARQGQLALFKAHDDHVAARKIAEDSSIAKSQFLATMSHELRTPLNAVIGYAEILEEDLGAEGMAIAASDARRIRRAARDLLALINEVLDLSKIEAGRMEVVFERAKVADIVADVVETTAHIASANADRVVVVIDPAVDELILDAGKLRQCLLNLVSNACKFTKGGEIEIVVTMNESAAGPRLRVCVSDTGVGIAPDQAARLFQPFVQADGSHTREYGGTGLGLVITRRLAQLMGGDVDMHSELGCGSRFTLTIAAQRPSPAIGEKRPEGADPVVLLIEDDATARDLCRRALARVPLRVVCATTADEGARMAAEVDPALIVMDIHFPDRLGWDLLAEFKANPLLAATPVLVVSIDDDRARAMALGACDHLIKPVDRDRLAAAVLRFARLPMPASSAGAAAKSAITKTG